MNVFHKLNEIPPNFGPTVVSIGNFDGVHRGHTLVVERMIRRARVEGLKSVVVTFDPHSVRVLRPDSDMKLLTPTSEKVRILTASELDAVLVLPFTRELSQMEPRQFAQDILKNGLHTREVHEGFNFHFGHKASGDVNTLAQLGREMKFEVVIYPEMRLRGEPVSSSHIRKLIAEGLVSRARHLLGRPFSIVSIINRGRGYGTKFTVPTVNLGSYDELVPKHGVYITRTRLGEECFDSVTNVGNRPTFGADSFAIEGHLLNFHPIELHEDTQAEIHFLERVRDEIKFPSVEALRTQIGEDVAKAQRYFHLLKGITR